MNKFDRLLYILNKLDQGFRVHPKEIAQELGVTERTVYRYLQTLQKADFPIEYHRERGTYAFVEGFSLKKALLSAEEILILALARKVLEPLGGEKLQDFIDRLEKRLASPMPKTEKFLSIFGIQPGGTDLKILDLLKDLSFAIREHECVEIEHEKEPGEREKREVEPYFIFFTGDFWYVHTWCRLRDAERTFALDKISSWRRTGRYFLPRKEVHSLKDVEEAFGPYVDDEPQEVIVRFDEVVSQYFFRRKWVKGQEVTLLDDGSIEVRFVVRGVQGLKSWLYKWLPWFEIVSPSWLREEVVRDLKTALAKNKKRGRP